MTWREIAVIKKHDNDATVAVLGQYVLPAFYVHGYASDGSGRVANYCVQERIEGIDLRRRMRRGGGAVLADPGLRRKLLEITWGTRRIAVDLGGPPDFYGGRNILISRDGRVVLNDTGFPTSLARVSVAGDIPVLIRLYFVAMIDFHLRFVSDLTRLLSPSVEEAEAMSERFDVSDQAFSELVFDVKNRKRNLLRLLKRGNASGSIVEGVTT